MKVLIKYVDFHYDNHQGGSGQSFEFTTSVEIPNDMLACEIKSNIESYLLEHCKTQRPFVQGDSPVIQDIKII